MFDVWCPGHGARVLLGTGAITELAHTPAGIVLHWRCTCGTTGTRSCATARPKKGHGEAA